MTMNDQSAPRISHPALDDLIAETLASGQFPAESSAAQHLAACLSCAHSFLQQVQMETAPQVRALQAHLADGASVLATREQAGMLALWQATLDASLRLEDDWSSATALSVIGMLRHEQRDDEEARLVHELALKTASQSGNHLSLLISHTGLGVLALRQYSIYTALEHLAAAGRSAAALHDREAEARARLLMLRALALSWMQVFEGLPDLMAQAMSLLRELLLVPAQAQLKAFYRSWLQPVYSMAPMMGESLLVLNTGQRIPIVILAGPNVDQQGVVKLRLRATQEMDQWGIPETADLELVFTPVQAVIGMLHLTEADRLRLSSNKGLLITGQLPRVDDELREHLAKVMTTHGGELGMPIDNFALHLRW